MIIYSFVRGTLGLSPVEVEVMLQKGIPKIEILGRPDKGLQESLVRIQAAIVHQGYEFPKAYKVVVNVRPIETKKSSLGLELSIALAILHLTGQKQLPAENPFFIYGELTLSGEVIAPKDLDLMPLIPHDLITGPATRGFTPQALDFYSLTALNSEFSRQSAVSDVTSFSRPPLPKNKIPKASARLMEIIAVGEHSALLAGPSGTGKTTFTQQLHSFLREPTEQERWDIHRIGKVFDEERSWRPLVMPHHSISVASMLGGGNGAKPGAIFKAHQGVLVLDELLEFHPSIQAALREPIEQKTITVSRNVQHHKYDAAFLTIGATNLCRCGAFVPKAQSRCRCTSLELRKYIDKLSGPFLDRFSIFEFTHQWKKDSGEGTDSKALLKSIEKGRAFGKQRQQQSNEDMTQEQLIASLADPQVSGDFPSFRSWRRFLSFLRVGRTIADLELSEKVHHHHLVESYSLTAQNHNSLDSLFL